MSELRECPFCGGEARRWEDFDAPKDCNSYVACKRCGVSTACQPDDAIAATAWNRRAHDRYTVTDKGKAMLAGEAQ